MWHENQFINISISCFDTLRNYDSLFCQSQNLISESENVEHIIFRTNIQLIFQFLNHEISELSIKISKLSSNKIRPYPTLVHILPIHSIASTVV